MLDKVAPNSKIHAVKIITETFPVKDVVVITGDATVAANLLSKHVGKPELPQSTALYEALFNERKGWPMPSRVPGS